ncbi:hypothetical protein PPOLYM_02576 [Paenibacillus polymyxa]|nr:hypothetical protein PPOLYM_02576 [Paenibacillus polymyxa]
MKVTEQFIYKMVRMTYIALVLALLIEKAF